MNDNQLMHAMSIDDTYRVEQVLARGEDGYTDFSGEGTEISRRRHPAGQNSPCPTTAVQNRSILSLK